MDATAVDQIRLHFNPSGLMSLNIVIGLMMFGMSLDLKLDDFKRILRLPKAPVVGLIAQFALLPLFTFLLTMVVRPQPSMALGMILIGSCPGGNLSNLMTYLAKGNTALSISMTAVSTAIAVIMTPLNLSVWGTLNPDTVPILRAVSLDPMDVFETIFFILGVPLACGLTVSRIWPRLVERVRSPFKLFALCVFIGVVALALSANWDIFLNVIGLVVFVVMLHNALALAVGYGAGRVMGLAPADTRAVTIEVGIQNSALGLILIFNFFDGLGGMAIIAAWWGIWHIISGLTVSLFWSRRAPQVPIVELRQ
ncbi:MAG: bile acid:sodium symporter family protein [Desulfarculus sp.]|nr:bile acid:sodium symporter family protein [Desulfarculus sp.]